MRSALAYHRATMGRAECQACCMPPLPPEVHPSTQTCVDAVMRIAAVLRRQVGHEMNETNTENNVSVMGSPAC